jgi:hypothetical protein
MSPRWLRRIVLLIFLSALVGMIVGSITDNNGVAITFGLMSAVGALGLILMTTVVPASRFDTGRRGTAAPDDEAAAEIERRIRSLVDAGADEHDVRVLVKRAIEVTHHTD